jgi:hypothetical protein
MRQPAASVLVSIGLATSIANAAPCTEPKLERVSNIHPECHFYKGTRHFRAKEYQAASQEWLAVVNAADTPKEFEHLRVDAQNNLGCLYYMGWGVERNPTLAIQRYWLPAEKAGHEEAAYHLCHAYAAEAPKTALGYCREALRRYGKVGDKEGDNSVVVEQILKHIARLEAR